MKYLRIWEQPWVTNTLLFLLGLAELGLARQLVREFHHFQIGFSGVAGWSVVVFAAAVIVVLTCRTNPYSLWIVLCFAAGFRLMTLLPAPFLSTDIYRYAWDGVVQHAHISPYRYVPGDPALTFLRGPHRDLFDHINRRDYARTIYPPVAQMLFYCVTALNASVTAMKLAMILLEAVSVYALVEMLKLLGRKRDEVLLYAWCPLLVWEIGSSGHLDSAVIAFMLLAMLARMQGRSVTTGLLLGAAVLTKFYPVVLFPALWRRRDWNMPAAMAGLAAVSYACYASVGKLVFGFLGGYVQEEGMQSGSRYFLLELAQNRLPWLPLTPKSFIVVVGVAMFALAAWSWLTANREGDQPGRSFWSRTFSLPSEAQFLPGAFFLAGAMMLAFAPHYPWYVAWLIPFGVLLPNVTVFVYTLGMFYLVTTPYGAGTSEAQYQLNCVLYGAVLVTAVVEILLRVWFDRRCRVAEAVA